ncbi:rhodanese-like protein [Calothrix sp. NIES-4071]|nr:rhodanese-like protein [Calothrix sp. NIES-4071]BAZ60297.1 rhodanese-like protein [Calothrix sp. NIES-4105]
MNVVSAQWLFEHLKIGEVVIIDCRFSLNDSKSGKQQYQQSHITGAYYFDLNEDLSAPVGEHGGRHPLPNLSELATKLSKMGVSHQTLVVAYDDSRLGFAARLWWLLRYIGHEKVAVLDGGFAGWLSLSYPVTSEVREPLEANLSTIYTGHVKSNMVADINFVKNRKDLPGVVLVDSRENERYLGIREPIDKIAGHIEGAVNYPWQSVTDSSGYLLNVEDQLQRWQDILGSQEIIVYCGSGVTACVNLLSLELAGFRNARLYAGSWSDWISY